MTDTVSTTEAAAILGGVSDALIRKRITQGKLPAEKIDGKWRIERTSLAAVHIEAHASATVAAGSFGELRTRLDASEQRCADLERHIASLERQVEEQGAVVRALTEARDVIGATPAPAALANPVRWPVRWFRWIAGTSAG